MDGEQTRTCQPRRVGRTAALLLWLVPAVGGLIAVVGPFMRAAPTWQWELQTQDDLVSAAVNAELIAIDQRGALLGRQGTRGISLITPPLALARDSNRVLVVEASRPDTAAGEAKPTLVRLLWQIEAVETYQYEEQTVLLDCRPAEIVFGLPAPPHRLHRLGIQFPEVGSSVLVGSFALPRLSIGERVQLAWQEVNAGEPITNYSINFIRGPRILGRGFNYYLVSAVFGAVGIYGVIRVARRRRVLARVILGIVLVVWILADGQATNNLARQLGAEQDEFRDKTWSEQITLMNGPEIGWAYAALSDKTPPGRSYAVVSDDAFTPARRLDYLLAPQRTLRESYRTADYVVVLRAGDVLFEERLGLFRWKRDPVMRVEKIAELSSEVYLLRVLPGPASGPALRSRGAAMPPAAGGREGVNKPPAGRAEP